MPFLIPKYAIKVAGGKFYVLKTCRKGCQVADSVGGRLSVLKK